MDFGESNQVFVEATHNAAIVFIMHTRKNTWKMYAEEPLNFDKSVSS